MAKKHIQIPEDDGHTIANMNIEGMPWYQPEQAPQQPHRAREQLSGRETLQVMLASMKYAFLMALALCIPMVLFIVFCVKVWFRG